MKFLLAMDNDAAGYQTVWRFLERYAGDPEMDCFPMPSPDDMMPSAYRPWLRTLNVQQLTQELERLKAEGDPEHNTDDITKAQLLHHEFIMCRMAHNHAKHREKYYASL